MGDVCINWKALLSRSKIAPVSCGQALLNSFRELWKSLIHLADINIKAIYRFDINKSKRQVLDAGMDLSQQKSSRQVGGLL